MLWYVVCLHSGPFVKTTCLSSSEAKINMNLLSVERFTCLRCRVHFGISSEQDVSNWKTMDQVVQDQVMGSCHLSSLMISLLHDINMGPSSGHQPSGLQQSGHLFSHDTKLSFRFKCLFLFFFCRDYV